MPEADVSMLPAGVLVPSTPAALETVDARRRGAASQSPARLRSIVLVALAALALAILALIASVVALNLRGSHGNTPRPASPARLSPATAWYFPPVITPIDQSVLVLSNPGRVAVHVTVRTVSNRLLAGDDVPPKSGTELDLAPPFASDALRVRADGPVLAQRSVIHNGTVYPSAGEPER